MSKGKYLGEFELYVLLALVKLAPEAYGVTIMREIEESTGRPVALGSIYSTLGRLSAKGLVRHHISDPEPVQGGRSKKFYELTPAGKRALHHSVEMLSVMIGGAKLGRQP